MNHRFGHGGGARVIVAMAEVLRDFAAKRPGAAAGLVDPEEFGLILPGVGIEEARVMAEALLSRMAVEIDQSRITASAGVAAITSERPALVALAAAREVCTAKSGGYGKVHTV
ncbi:MAG: diguanylate cyclase [Dehalococcoidia bacterium]